ncbi:hypothetical protein V1523DRAFT_429279 [Lipomyces doorenjongii]
MAGFQPLLGKVMVWDSDKDYFCEVQEHAKLERYATIWAKVLWITWLYGVRESASPARTYH